MIRTIALCALILLSPSLFGAVCRADFDERFWEKYAEILVPQDTTLPPLGSISLDPRMPLLLKYPYDDIRILTASRKELPYKIVTQIPETKTEEVPVKMLNLSRSKQNETIFAGVIEKPSIVYNTVEIVTEERNFYRQVQVFGSSDEKQWNSIRLDGVIFDHSKEENLRLTRIRLPDSNYRYLAFKIMNNSEKPLTISALKVFYVRSDPGAETGFGASIQRTEQDQKNKQSIIEAKPLLPYPVRKIVLLTTDKNFKRAVEIFVRDAQSDKWLKWADDMIYDFDTENARESKISVTFPETSSRNFRLLIKNYDSPPLKIAGIEVAGFRKTLVFKLDDRQKYYLFWGNPQARTPQYDISDVISKYNIKGIPTFSLGAQMNNPGFTDPLQRLPFTERYRHVLYVIVVLLIMGLIVLQYRVFKKTGHDGLHK